MKYAPAALLSVVALLGAAAGFYGYRHYSAVRPGLVPVANPPSASVGRATDAAAEAPPEAPARTVPEEVPDLRLPDLAGKPHALREIPGHARLFNFWATWCEPCRREIPLLNTLQAAYAADGLQIVGIAVDFRDAVREFARTTKLDYMSLVGEDDGLEAAQKFGVDLALPFSVFADEHNRIMAVKVGELHWEEADAIFAHMRALRAGSETLPDARAAISTALKALAVQRSNQSGHR